MAFCSGIPCNPDRVRRGVPSMSINAALTMQSRMAPSRRRSCTSARGKPGLHFQGLHQFGALLQVHPNIEL